VLRVPTREELSFTEGSVGRPLFWLAVPTVATTLLQTVYNLTDTFWVGRYGSAELAALTFAFPLVFFALALGSGVSTTGRVLVAQYEGRGDPARVRFAAGQTLVFGLLVSAAVGVAGLLSLRPLLAAFGASPDVADLAFDYLLFVLAGLPTVVIAFAVSALLQGYGDAVTPFLVVLGSVLLNLVLDPVLIFGLWGVPELGLTGAAIATLLARGAAAVVGVWLLLSGRVGLRVSPSDLVPERAFFGRVLEVGVPASLETTAIAVSVTAMLFVVGRFDPAVVAGFGVGERVSSLMFLPAIGVASAATTVVGQNLGADEPGRARRAARLAVAVPLVALTGVGLLVAVLATPIASVFTTDPAVVGRAGDFLRVIGPAFGFEAAARVYAGVFRGAGRTRLALGVTATTFLPVRVGLGLLLVTWGFGPLSVWLAYALSGVVGALLGFAVARVVPWDERIVE
jgi:putative MATE family efflux protein